MLKLKQNWMVGWPSDITHKNEVDSSDNRLKCLGLFGIIIYNYPIKVKLFDYMF